MRRVTSKPESGFSLQLSQVLATGTSTLPRLSIGLAVAEVAKTFGVFLAGRNPWRVSLPENQAAMNY